MIETSIEPAATPSAWSARATPGRRHGRAKGERGFALLLVFAMAAVVAITLYMQLPRVAFEAQRDRETMLIQRGKQYQRAIELYVRKNNRYPARLEDLEREQDVRFLRRRYKDPLTGKDEWRIIHINAAGQLEDSLVQKPKTGGNAETASTTAEEVTGDEDVAENTALARQRPGDQTAANAAFPGGGEGGAGPVPGNQQANMTGTDEGLVPMLDASGNVIQRTRTEAEAQAQQGLATGQLAAGGTPAGANPGNPGNPPTPGQAQPQVRLGPGGIPIIENPGAAIAGSGNPQGANVPAGAGQPGLPAAGNTGSGGGGAPGEPGGQGSAQALLQNLLTREVPGGLAGIQQRRGIQPAGGAQQGMGAGIAGVASKYEMRGILVFDEQESIHKWEFVYDARKASGAAGNAAQTGNRGAQGQFGQGSTGGFGGGPGGGAGNPNQPRRGTGSSPVDFGPGGFGGGSSGPGSGGRPATGRRP